MSATLSVMGKYGTGSIYLRGKTWWVRYWHRGQLYRESSESPERDDAEKLLKRRLGETVTGKFAGLRPERIKIGELLDALQADYLLHRKASLPQLKSRLKHLRPFFKKIRAADFTTALAAKYREKRSKIVSASTINRELEILRRAFRLAAEQDPPLVARVPKITMVRVQNVRVGFLEHDGYLRLRDTLPSYLRLLFIVGFHTGIRSGVLRRLEWRQVDLKAGRIYLWSGTTKNREGRTVPIYGDMAAEMEMAWAKQQQEFPQCSYVFQHWGKPIGEFRKAWSTACTAAGLDGLKFHDLRRSAVRNMSRAGIPEKVIMEIIGHKTRAIFDRYNIVSERDISLATEFMERWWEQNRHKNRHTAEPTKELLT